MASSPTDVYAVGEQLELFPFEPGPPHGIENYQPRPLPATLAAGQIRDFDTNTTKYIKTKATVRIEQAICVGNDRESQILRCKVVQAPMEVPPHSWPLTMHSTQTGARAPLARSLALKVYDCEFYPLPGFGGSKVNAQASDGNFSREYAVYRCYRDKGLTGHPYAMPQFYGGWVTKIRSKNGNGSLKFRYVSLILIDFIHGRSIESLCSRQTDPDDPEYIGEVTPTLSPVAFSKADGGVSHITFDEKTRKLVIKKFLHGLAFGNHLGIEHRGLRPWNVFITLRDGNTNLDDLRVVFLDHAIARVWHYTTQAKPGVPHVVSWLPYPPHPWERSSVEALDRFHGWWPPAYQKGVDRKQLYDDWIFSKDVFGPLEEAQQVVAELEARGITEWPHPYPKFSTFETLKKLIEDRREKDEKEAATTAVERQKELGEQEQKTGSESLQPQIPPIATGLPSHTKSDSKRSERRKSG